MPGSHVAAEPGSGPRQRECGDLGQLPSSRWAELGADRSGGSEPMGLVCRLGAGSQPGGFRRS